MELLQIEDRPTRATTTVRLKIRLEDLFHIEPELIDRFAAGTATAPESRQVVRHLLEGCPSCSRRLGRLVPLENPLGSEDAYDESFDRSLDRAFEVLQQQACGSPMTVGITASAAL